jgi:general secretion pathway protein A
VNQLCDLALVYAFINDQTQVNRLTVQQVLDDGVFFAAGTCVAPSSEFRSSQPHKVS